MTRRCCRFRQCWLTRSKRTIPQLLETKRQGERHELKMYEMLELVMEPDPLPMDLGLLSDDSSDPNPGTSNQGTSADDTSSGTDQGESDDDTAQSSPETSAASDNQIELPKQVELRDTTIGSLFDGSNSPFQITVYTYIDGTEIQELRLDFNDVKLISRE